MVVGEIARELASGSWRDWKRQVQLARMRELEDGSGRDCKRACTRKSERLEVTVSIAQMRELASGSRGDCKRACKW